MAKRKNRTVRQYLSLALYPLGLIAAVGMSLQLPAPYGLFAVFAFTACLVHLLERWNAFSAAWHPHANNWRLDAIHLLFSSTLPSALVQVVLFPSLVQASLLLQQSLGARLWPQAPTTIPAWAGQLALALLIAEVGYYCLHRAAHQVPALWKFHSLHHSVDKLYWLNASVFHPVETALTYVAETLPLVMLGAPPRILVGHAAFTIANGMWKHSNIDLPAHPLDHVLCTANLHRFHHSRELSEGMSNYASNLSLLDRLGGTFCRPQRTPNADIGIDEAGPRGRYVAHLLWPFRKAAGN